MKKPTTEAVDAPTGDAVLAADAEVQSDALNTAQPEQTLPEASGAELMPDQGGSYTRNADGSLTLNAKEA